MLVIVVLFIFLGNLRAALITALVIPLSMLATFTGMVANSVSANLMSLGALDFGIIIDGAVVIVENCVRRLGQAQSAAGRPLTRAERFEEVFAAARETRRPLLFGQLIIMVVYLPIFALTGVEGKMFHPMAFTVVAALLAAMVLSITFVPAAIALFIGDKFHDKDGRVMDAARRAYRKLLDWTFTARALVLSVVGVSVVLCALLATRLGSEFIPSLDEGDVTLHALRIPGTSLTQAAEMQMLLERTIKKLPEVDIVFSKLGTAEIANDPMPPNVADTFIMLKPESAWPKPKRSREAFLKALQETVEAVPGNNYELTQPIEMRFNELLSGVRSDVAIKVFGDDRDTMASTADSIAAALREVDGAADVKVEQTTGLPMLTIKIDREKAARLGVSIHEVQELAAAAIGGRQAGVLFEGDRRFDIVVRLADALRIDLEVIGQLPLRVAPRAGLDAAAFVRLSDVAQLDMSPGPNQVSRENGKRLVVVTANVRGRDVGSFVRDAQARIAQQVKIPPGYWTTWGGTFEQLQSATRRLMLVVPATLAIVFILLYAMFGNLRDGLLVFTGIPFALTGGLVALSMRGIPMSISAAVGFIALSGVAVLNGLVMVSFIRTLREQGMPLQQAIENGAMARLRPVLMTALVASVGFLPMALATGTGAEVQRPLATVVIGGVLSSTLLTLLVLPLMYHLAYRRHAKIGAGALDATSDPTLKTP